MAITASLPGDPHRPFGPASLWQSGPVLVGARGSGGSRAVTPLGWALVALPCLVLLRLGLTQGLTGDTYWHVTAGRWMVSHQAFMTRDIYSYTLHGRPWTDVDWAWEVALAWLVESVGPVAYWLASAVAAGATVLVVEARARLMGAGWLRSALLGGLVAAGLASNLQARPGIAAMLLFALELLALTLGRRDGRWLVAVPFVLWVWANTHGSFLLGLGVLALEVAWASPWARASRLRSPDPLELGPVSLTLFASALASLLNPHGARLYSAVLRIAASPSLGQISRSLPLDLSGRQALALVAAVVVGTVGCVMRRRKRVAPDDLLLSALLLLLAVNAGRFLPYVLIAWAGWVARQPPLDTESVPGPEWLRHALGPRGHLRRTLPRPTRTTWPLLLVVVAAAFLPGPYVAPGSPARYGSAAVPVRAVAWLTGRTGRTFAAYGWSGYLIYEGLPVFVDGRSDLYLGTDVPQEYLAVAALRVDPDTVLLANDVRWVLWPSATALSTWLSGDPSWRLEWHRGGVDVFGRSAATHA
ncbi:MAG: hypothetical protein ACRDYD_09545 [Acidimicrobiales bacterium]